MNNKIEHTPGPWLSVRDGFRYTIGNAKTVHTTTPHNYMVAEIPDNSMQAKVNAHLIASAPDLLRGCQAALAYLVDPQSEHKINREEAARIILAAVARAKGKA